ncbi:MAG: hypothetical protein KA779_06235 [Propionivibrio sp.]|nr:hypothetical protein [Propionivibrio sp.]MBP7524336.1 hypothetical protein [Propionivibrio sp.]
MFYFLTIVPVAMIVVAIYRYWVSARRLHLFDEIVRRAPNWLPLDGVAVGAAGFVLYYASMDWWGFSIPMLNQEPLPAWGCMFMAVASCVGCLAVAYFNAGKRFEHPSWVGMAESVLRSAVALRIIDSAELIRTLKATQQYGISNPNSAIEGEAREVSK